MNSYQPIYDAVRSKITGGDITEAVENAIRDSGISHYAQQASYRMQEAITEYERPCVLFRPRLFIDENLWCALYGDNLQDGVCGFGISPAEAMRDFDKSWLKKDGI